MFMCSARNIIIQFSTSIRSMTDSCIAALYNVHTATYTQVKCHIQMNCSLDSFRINRISRRIFAKDANFVFSSVSFLMAIHRYFYFIFRLSNIVFCFYFNLSVCMLVFFALANLFYLFKYEKEPVIVLYGLHNSLRCHNSKIK